MSFILYREWLYCYARVYKFLSQSKQKHVKLFRSEVYYFITGTCCYLPLAGA